MEKSLNVPGYLDLVKLYDEGDKWIITANKRMVAMFDRCNGETIEEVMTAAQELLDAIAFERTLRGKLVYTCQDYREEM